MSKATKDIFKTDAVVLAHALAVEAKNYRNFGFEKASSQIMPIMGYSAIAVGLFTVASDIGLADISVDGFDLSHASTMQLASFAVQKGLVINGAYAMFQVGNSFYNHVKSWFANLKEKEPVYTNAAKYLENFGIKVDEKNPVVWTNGKVWLVKDEDEPYLRSVSKNSFVAFMAKHSGKKGETFLSIASEGGSIVCERTVNGKLTYDGNGSPSRIVVTKEPVSGQTLIKQEWHIQGEKIKERVVDTDLNEIEYSAKVFEKINSDAGVMSPI